MKAGSIHFAPYSPLAAAKLISNLSKSSAFEGNFTFVISHFSLI